MGDCRKGLLEQCACKGRGGLQDAFHPYSEMIVLEEESPA